MKYDNVELKLINDNDWCYKFDIFYKGSCFVRFKIYDKTAERLSSKGVTNMEIGDPFT